MIIFIVVVLPAPFGPRSPKSSPFFMARLRLSMALTDVFLRLNRFALGVLVLNVFVKLTVWMAYSFCNRDPFNGNCWWENS